MNTLLIIGNGFDLNHGLETSYSHYLKYILLNLADKPSLANVSDYPNYKEAIEMSNGELNLLNVNQNNLLSGLPFDTEKIRANKRIKYENTFLEHLTGQSKLSNWSDIEHNYFNIFKYHFFQLEKDKYISYYLYLSKLYEHLEELNKNVKILFSDFISYITKINKVQKQPKTEIGHIISKLKNRGEVYVLNFNYTDTIEVYGKDLHINYIHGKLDSENKPFLGYGDESDQVYKQIEDLNENEYLKYIKSFIYLQNNNYSDLQNFINKQTNSFKIAVLGHSCGLSDKTLLSPIMNHEKCAEIYLYHYTDDDFTQKSYNISRYFSDKTVLRNKVKPFDHNLRF